MHSLLFPVQVLAAVLVCAARPAEQEWGLSGHYACTCPSIAKHNEGNTPGCLSVVHTERMSGQFPLSQSQPHLWAQETLQQYQQLLQNLERVVQPDEGLHPSFQAQEGDEPPLQIILHNLYRYLMAVTANLDKLNEGVADARQAFLDKRKQVPHIFVQLPIICVTIAVHRHPCKCDERSEKGCTLQHALSCISNALGRISI